jgi:hypothetical protein
VNSYRDATEWWEGPGVQVRSHFIAFRNMVWNVGVGKGFDPSHRAIARIASALAEVAHRERFAGQHAAAECGAEQRR